MNTLIKEIKRSLKELELGLKGELTMTSEMENLSNALFFDQVFIQYISSRASSYMLRCLLPGRSWHMLL